MANTTLPLVKSATRTLDVIEFVVARDHSVAAQEIAAALGIPLSSLSYLLSTLVERDYLVREGRRYSAGPGLDRLHVRAGKVPISVRAAPLVRLLRLQLNETASFFVRRDWEMEALVTETSDHALRYAVQTGTRTPLYCYSAGKALLATMTDAELDHYLAKTALNGLTASTITDGAVLRSEIDAIRRSGIARTREESTPGIQGVGRAVVIDGTAVGAFAIAIPNVRFDAAVEQRAAELLISTGALLAH